jgi:DNA-binding PadR family transcriptional regulator
VPRGSKLTTTSYAVLGLLAIRPWTPYEMTQQMQRSLSRFWPRTVSKLYEEPKKLAEHHLAASSDERTGQRTRTRYAITPAGRRQLASWLAQPTQEPVLELEFLVRVFLAEHGTRDDLLATLTAVTAWAEQRALLDAEIAEGYLAGTGPFPERAAQLVLVGRYLSDFSAMTERWARWAIEQVEQWPDDPSARTPDWATLRDIARQRRGGQG